MTVPPGGAPLTNGAPPGRAGIYIALAVLAFLVHELQWVLLPFVICGLIAYLCTPAIERLAKLLRKPRAVAAILVFIVIATLFAAIAALSAQPLLEEVVSVVASLDRILQTLTRNLLRGHLVTLLGQQVDADQLAQAAISGVRTWAGDTGRLAAFGGAAFAALFGSALGIVLLFYFLVDGPKLVSGFLWLVPQRHAPLFRAVLQRVDPLLRRYFFGVFIVLVYTAAAAYIGLGLILHLRHAALLACVTGILEIVPVVGPGAAAVLGGLVALRSATSVWAVLGYAIYAASLRLSIDQILGPLALGAAARLNPTVIIFSFLCGGVLFGLIGIILAVPVALTVKVSVAVLRSQTQPPEKQ